MELWIDYNKLAGSIPLSIGLLIQPYDIESMNNNNFMGRIPESFLSTTLDHFDIASIENVCYPGD
jgi:hypothetical protein